MYLHRMIVVLGEELLPFVPPAVHGLLAGHSCQDLVDFIPLINHLMKHFKAKLSPFLDQVFLPLVEVRPWDEGEKIEMAAGSSA
jgi:exportin-T